MSLSLTSILLLKQPQVSWMSLSMWLLFRPGKRYFPVYTAIATQRSSADGRQGKQRNQHRRNAAKGRGGNSCCTLTLEQAACDRPQVDLRVVLMAEHDLRRPVEPLNTSVCLSAQQTQHKHSASTACVQQHSECTRQRTHSTAHAPGYQVGRDCELLGGGGRAQIAHLHHVLGFGDQHIVRLDVRVDLDRPQGKAPS